jgi:hypothetical protein
MKDDAMGKLGKSSSGGPPAVVSLALLLSGCGSFGGFPSFGGSSPAPEPVAVEPAAAPEIPASVRSSEVVGRWGYASFHRPEDRARTEAAAKGQCSHPFVIGQGPTGGVMMYPPDQSQMQEFWLKGGPGGKNYIGPHGAGGANDDREIVSFDGRVMVLRYVDPEVAGRYGTGVYVRCAPKA